MISIVWLNSAFTFMLIGLIWTIQLVHYPLFAKVGENNFLQYHAAHSAQITILVLPLMLGELCTSIYLVMSNLDTKSFENYFGLILVCIVWLSTLFIQVPIHNKLSNGFDIQLIESLTNTNWIRTIAWSTKGLLFIYTFFK